MIDRLVVSDNAEGETILTQMRRAIFATLVLLTLRCADRPETLGHQEQLPVLLGGEINVPSSGQGRIPLRSRVLPVFTCVSEFGQEAIFLIDTGATTTLVSEELASRWKLRVRDMGGDAGQQAVSTRSTGWFARLPKVSMGDVNVVDLDALVIPLAPAIAAMGISGVFGMAALSERMVLFDGSRATIRIFLQGDAERLLIDAYPGSSWIRIRYEESNELPFIDLVACNKELRFLFDTGSVSTRLSQGGIRKLDLVPIRSVSMATVNAYEQSTNMEDVYYARGVDLAGWELSFEASVSHLPFLKDQKADGVLGFDFLRQIPFMVDCMNRVIWVKRSDAVTNGSKLDSSIESRAATFIDESLPGFRKLGAALIGTTKDRRLAQYVAKLLTDQDSEVRSVAAQSLSEIAGVKWRSDAPIEDARTWWAEHKDDRLDPQK